MDTLEVLCVYRVEDYTRLELQRLCEYGFSITTSHACGTALEMIRNRPFNAIVMNAILPPGESLTQDIGLRKLWKVHGTLRQIVDPQGKVHVAQHPELTITAYHQVAMYFIHKLHDQGSYICATPSSNLDTVTVSERSSLNLDTPIVVASYLDPIHDPALPHLQRSLIDAGADDYVYLTTPYSDCIEGIARAVRSVIADE